jgi:hypothetical protein
MEELVMQSSMARQRQSADIARLERELSQLRDSQQSDSLTLSGQIERCTKQLQGHSEELSVVSEERINAQASKVKMEAALSLAQEDVRVLLLLNRDIAW